MEFEFYLVWRENGPPPSHKHTSEHLAKAEAERLASHSPGVRFFVLTARDFVVAQRPVTWGKLDEVPF